MVIDLVTNIAARPEQVWPYIVEWEQLGRWMKEASGFRVTSPQREGVGVEADAVIRIGFLTTIDPIRVSRWEPPHVLEIEHRGWVSGMGLMQCEPHADGTQFRWTETLVPPWGLLGRVGLLAWGPLVRRTFERDLQALKVLVERERT